MTRLSTWKMFVAIGMLTLASGCSRVNPLTPIGSLQSAVEIEPTPDWAADAYPLSDTELPAYAFDRDPTTYFSTGQPQSGNEYFKLDMGSAQTFNRFVMDSADRIGDYASCYQIYVSQDGTSFGTPIASGTGSSQLISVTFPTQTARFILVRQTCTSSNWWSIAELYVYRDDICTPESDQAFCTRMGASCGRISGIDNCGQPRTVPNCGSCNPPAICGGTPATEVPTANDPRESRYGPASDTYSLGMRFTTTVAGRITGLRLQAPAGVTHAVNLSTESGVLLANVDITGAGHVFVQEPINIQANAGDTFVVWYYTGNQRWYFGLNNCPVNVTRGNILIRGCPYASGNAFPTIDAANLRAADIAFSVPTSPNVCANCVSETNTGFCARLGRNCGQVTGIDNCGVSRTVPSCGTCTQPWSCGTNNVCACALTSPDPTSTPFADAVSYTNTSSLVIGGSYRYVYTRSYAFSGGGFVESLPSPASNIAVPRPSQSFPQRASLVLVHSNDTLDFSRVNQYRFYRTTNGGNTYYFAWAGMASGDFDDGLFSDYSDSQIVSHPQPPTMSTYCPP